MNLGRKYKNESISVQLDKFKFIYLLCGGFIIKFDITTCKKSYDV